MNTSFFNRLLPWLFAGTILCQAQAAQIIWVVQEDGPAGVEFPEMLRTDGHDVELMVVADEPPTTDQQNTMNAADLVVVSRKVNSGNGAYNTFVWNDTITTPLISHTPYILRTNDTERWQWMDGTGLADATPSPVEANLPDHKVFEGLTLTDGLSSEWHFAIDRNTSVSTDAVAKGGKAIATKTDGPPGAIIVAEWETGQVAVGPRMMFMMGAREPAENEGIGADYGRFNLTEAGQIAFLNSISYYAGPWGASHLWATFGKDLGEVDSAPGGQGVTILVKNLGLDAPVNLTNLSFSGPGAEFYSIKSAPDSLAPTEVAEIAVTLDTNGNTGSFDAELIIENDSTLESIRNRTVAFAARALNFAGPAAHYTLDETEGEEIRDVTGNERHAVASGDIDLTAATLVGGDGSAASFNGGQVTADFASLGEFTDFSIAFWMNANDGGDELQTIVAKDDGGTPSFGILRGGSNLQWFVGDSAQFETTDDPVVPGTPLYVAAVYSQTDNETLTLYLDGEEVAQASDLEPFDDFGESPFVIGSFNGIFSFNGAIDDVQVYNRLLEADEVKSMFDNPGSFPTGGPPIIEPPEGGEATAVWVSGVESDAGKEFQDLLRDNGFEVTEMLTSDPTAEEQAILNDAGVVIVSRKVSSGDYNNSTWDDQITAPLILMSAYLSRANRWAWLDGSGLVDITPETITADLPDHPIFEGIDITDGSTAAWHTAIDRGTSAPTDPIANGGTVIASSDGSMIAAEWEAGAVAAGKRLLFLAGSREADGNGIGTAGQYDLTEIGEAAFLNAVRHLAGVDGGGSGEPIEGLLGYWRLDGDATDASGGGSDGSVVNPDDVWKNDADRGGVYQSGNGSYIELGTLPTIGVDTDFTWSFWVNADETDNNNIVFGNRWGPDGTDFAPREFIKFTPRAFEWHFDGGGENVPGDNTMLVVGEWAHNLVVKSGDTLTYYRNGAEVASSTITGSPVNAQPLYLGGQNGNEIFSGLFDEVAVFDRALSAAEVTDVYNRGLAGEPLGGGESPGGGDRPFTLENVGLSASGAFTMTIPAGETADIEYSTNLIDWEVIATSVTDTVEETDAGRLAAPEGYYRAK